jgi:hypothetical protein
MSHIMEAVAAPTTNVCGSMSFDRASLKPITQLLPDFIMVKADQAYTVALHNTMQGTGVRDGRTVAGIGSGRHSACRGSLYPDTPGAYHVGIGTQQRVAVCDL